MCESDKGTSKGTTVFQAQGMSGMLATAATMANFTYTAVVTNWTSLAVVGLSEDGSRPSHPQWYSGDCVRYMA